MAGRRVLWHRVVEARRELTSTTDIGNDENMSPILDDAGRSQERHDLLQLSRRPRPRLPLRDITHLFPGNVLSVDDKIDLAPPAPQAQENSRVRRPAAPSGHNPRKRRHVQTVSEPSVVRSAALRKTFR